MSKTFKITVNFPLTLVVSTETVKELTEAREAAREISGSGKVLKGEPKFRVELLASDKPDDEVLETIYRSGIRQLLRDDFMKELCGDEGVRGRLGDVKVVFDTPKVPRSCQGCTQVDCADPARLTNAGCPFKITGVRSAHFEQRFETTQ